MTSNGTSEFQCTCIMICRTAAWLCVRPSGTEPKVKFYYGVKGTSLADADAKSEAMGKEVLADD